MLRGRVASIMASLFDILTALGLLPFSGWLMDRVFASVLKSIHFMFSVSPYRAAVSLSVCKNVARLCFVPLMSWSSSFSVGMNTIF